MFETLLQSFFFKTASTAGGTGIASLQFGSGSNRRLQSEELKLHASKAVDLDIFAVQSVDYVLRQRGYSGAMRLSGHTLALLIAFVIMLVITF